jgi:hypothetical protein
MAKVTYLFSHLSVSCCVRDSVRSLVSIALSIQIVDEQSEDMSLSYPTSLVIEIEPERNGFLGKSVRSVGRDHF